MLKIKSNDWKRNLVNACSAFAKQLLKDYGEFYPFSFAIKGDDVVSVVTEGHNDFPKSTEEIIALTSTLFLLNNQEKFNAVCICIDVTIIDNLTKEKINALEIRIDTIGSKSVNVYIPYSKSLEGFVLLDAYEEEGNLNLFEPMHNIPKTSGVFFTLRRIMEDACPILFVVRDFDNNWQFLDGGNVSIDDLMIVSITDILKHDKSVFPILEIEKGCEVKRVSINDIWELTGNVLD